MHFFFFLSHSDFLVDLPVAVQSQLSEQHQLEMARTGLILAIVCALCGQFDGPLLEATAAQQVANSSATSAAGGQFGWANCARNSQLLSRQTLIDQFEQINQLNSIWFNDVDKEELVEAQRQSLSQIVMAGAGAKLLSGDGKLLLEVESSYFVPPTSGGRQLRPVQASGGQQQQHQQANNSPIRIELNRRHPDKCAKSSKRNEFIYSLQLVIGPIEHHLDVIYNLPKELRLTQPIDWRYGQVIVNVDRMHYELELRQSAEYSLRDSNCPLEVADLTYLSSYGEQQNKSPKINVSTQGLAPTNQTAAQIERLFGDYTRPAVSNRLRQLLKFHLSGKTLPLFV